jgi:hypothetical protein
MNNRHFLAKNSEFLKKKRTLGRKIMGCNCPPDSLSEREDSNIRDGPEFQNLLGTESKPPIKRDVLSSSQK